MGKLFFFTMVYPIKIPALVRALYPGLTWHKDRNKKELYLTFDDGPSPEITEEVLTVLEKFQVKACFFLIGDKIRKFPEVYTLLKNSPHQIGNHTYNHLNGWKTKTSIYLENIAQCDHLIHSKLFRPPYGKIKRSQINKIRDKEIIMWDVLSGDFDTKLSGKDCLNNLISKTENGSIIVMHDSEKAKERLLYALPRFLEWAIGEGYSFKLFQ